MRSFKLAYVLPVAILAITGCIDGDDASDPYALCTGAAEIALIDPGVLNPCVNGNGTPCIPARLDELALPRGQNVQLPIQVKDAEGHLCDPQGMQIKVGDSSLVEIVSRGRTTTLVAHRDAFDDPETSEFLANEQDSLVSALRSTLEAGGDKAALRAMEKRFIDSRTLFFSGAVPSFEPHTLVTVTVDDISVTWDAVGVVNYAGPWNGSSSGQVYDKALGGPWNLSQHGRYVSGLGCPADPSLGCRSEVGFFSSPGRLHIEDGITEDDLFLQIGKRDANGLWFVSANPNIFAYDLRATRIQDDD